MKKKNISAKLAKALLQLKLTEKEINTYIALLGIKQASIVEIARETGVNRVSVYAAIDELKQKGLVAESRQGKRKVFVAENPDVLLSIHAEKKREMVKDEELLQNIVLPMLKAINVGQINQPQIKFFDSVDNIERVFDEYLLRGSDVINCGSYETAKRIFSEKDELKYFEMIKEKKIFFRMILEDTALNHKFVEYGRGIVHAKFLPVGTKVSADIVISGSVTALISYERKMATVIEDESIAQAIKMYLDFMWLRL